MNPDTIYSRISLNLHFNIDYYSIMMYNYKLKVHKFKLIQNY